MACLNCGRKKDLREKTVVCKKYGCMGDLVGVVRWCEESSGNGAPLSWLGS